MQLARSGIAGDPRRFGKGVARAGGIPTREDPSSADLKLFATTFAAGFLFVSLLIA